MNRIYKKYEVGLATSYLFEKLFLTIDDALVLFPTHFFFSINVNININYVYKKGN